MLSRNIRSASARFAFGAGISALALGIAMPAHAQDTQAKDKKDDSTQEIVVTAQFRQQNLQDTPLAITAVNSALLASRNETDLSQVAAQAPNVQLTQMGGAFGSSMAAYIRGIGQYDFNPAYEPGVGLYVDDVYYATLTGNVLDLLDLDRVEVLRGPQGTLTGRNSIGGAIKLFSKKPSAENSGNIEAAYGARNRTDLRASMNFKLTDDLFARVAGVYKHQDGYVNQIDYGCANPGNALGLTTLPSTNSNCVMDKLGEKNYAGLRASLRYNPSDKFDWILTGDYTYEKRTNAAGVMTKDNTAKTDGIDFTCGRFCTYANWFLDAGGQATQAYYMPNKTKFTGWGLSSDLTIGLADNVSLKSITAYRHYREIFGTDDDYTPDPNIAGGGFNDLKFDFFSQELRLNAKLGDLADLTLGGYYSKQKSVYFTRQDIRYIGHGLPFLDLQFQGNDPVRANSKAVFGTVILHPTPAMNITGGVRYTKEHKDYTFVRKNFSGGPLTDIFGVGLLDGTVANYDGSRWDYRISVDYRFSPQVLAYATISTGFKGGGVTARPFTKPQAVNGTFNPETLTAYEVGLKNDLFDRRVRLNLAAFYNDYKNIQLPLADCAVLDGFAPGTDPFPCAAIGNAGDGKMYGFEAEFNATPVDGFDIDASLSYIDGEWKRIGAAVGNSIQLSDPIVSPHWRWSVGAQYKAMLGNGAGSITPRLDLAYTGKQNLGRLPGSTTLDYNPSQAIANARITWKNEDEDLSVSFEVQNLFDKYYLLPIRFAALYAFAGTTYSNVGKPREWAISVRKDF
ncbi:MAG: TonB-dependent receptor [Sphingomonadales bacterium]|nr:TonB-dependent receptor [Sphingomonadales bacterium]MDE2567449.1 TonB-dependent receptor [Sphingomonadales bacterium]